MKLKNVKVGLRVKVNDSSPMDQAKGKFGTVVGEPSEGFGGGYVKVVIDGVDTPDDCHTLDINSLKYSDEVPEIGDRIVVRKGGGDRSYYHDGASGIVQRIDSDGDAWVRFDSGEYRVSPDGTWCASPTRLAIIRNVERLLFKVKKLEQKLQAIDDVLKGGNV